MAFQAKNVFFIFKWFYKIKRKSNICGTESPISVFLSSINRTHVFLSFPCGSAGQESTHNVEDLGSIPGLGRSPGEGKGPTPVFWPREVHGLYGPWGRKESDTTERLSLPRAPGWSLDTYFFTIYLFGYAGSWLQHARPSLRHSEFSTAAFQLSSCSPMT